MACLCGYSGACHWPLGVLFRLHGPRRGQIVPPVRVLIVDDNPGFLEVVLEILQEEFIVVGTLSSGASVVDTVADLRPDVVVLDLSLGDTTGFEVARRLKSAGSSARIVFLTIHEGAEFVRKAIQLGVTGYVYKSQAAQDLPMAVRAAFGGKTFFSQDVGELTPNHS